MKYRKEIFGILERVSSDKQIDGESLESQRELAHEVVKKYDGEIYEYYTEEGVSASKKRIHQRPKMQKLIQDIKDGKVNHVIAYKRDRIMRNTIESLQFLQILAENDCKITLTARGESQINIDEYAMSGGSKMLEVLLAQLAEMEAATTSVRVSDNMIYKAKKGEFTGGIAPYGYRSENSKLIPIESEIEVIEEIADLYLQGYGTYSIARWLNGENVKGLGKRHIRHPKLKQHSRSKDTWTKDSIEGVLFNKTYCGYLTYTSIKNNKFGKTMDDIVVKSEFVTPIRTEEKQKAIDRLRKNKRDNKREPRRYSTPFLLTGILTCAECGGKYITKTSQRKDGTRYSYYFCKNRVNVDSTRCYSRSYKKETLETFVLRESKKYMDKIINSNTYEIIKKQIDEQVNESASMIKELEEQLSKLSKKEDNIMDMIFDLNMDDATYPIMKKNLQSKLSELLLEKTNIEKSIEELVESQENKESKNIDIEFIINTAKNFSKVIETAPVNLQKQFLEELFTKVEIDKEGNVNLELSIPDTDDLERIVDFISLGGVGDTTTLKDIKNENDKKSFNINVLNEYKSIIKDVEDNLFEFMIYKNGGKKLLYKRFVQGYIIPESEYFNFKNKKRTPLFSTLERILSELNSTIVEFIDYINPKEKSFYQTMLREALDYKIQFVENKRYV